MKQYSQTCVARRKRARKQQLWVNFHTACNDPSFRVAAFIFCIQHISTLEHKPIPQGIPVREWERKQRRDRQAIIRASKPPRKAAGRFSLACESDAFRMAMLHVCVDRIRGLKRRPLVTEELKRKSLEDTKKRHREKNLEKIRARSREGARQRRRDGRDAAYMKRRLQDPVQRIKWINRSRIHSALYRQSASKLVRSIIGADAKTLRHHIESKFKPGMNWDNQGRTHGTWQLDHVRPLSSFDLRDIEQQKLAFHYSNLSPMWFDENVKKSSFWNGRKWRHTDHAKEALN